MADAEIKREEERKRDRAYEPLNRWLHIQQTITWAEANLPPELRRNRPRLPRQAQGEGAKTCPAQITQTRVPSETES